jgi:hypothetical protein
MVRLLLLFLVFQMLPFSQEYFGNPVFRMDIQQIPIAAHVEGWSHGSIKTNDVVIDLSILRDPWPDSNRPSESITNSWVDRKEAAHTFHYYVEYADLGVAFGYDLDVKPYDSDLIECTFKTLTDPVELPRGSWPRNENLKLVTVPISPMVIKDGGIIAFTTYPLGDERHKVTHYLQLKRIDLRPATIE